MSITRTLQKVFFKPTRSGVRGGGHMHQDLEQVATAGVQVISVDVFDTCVARLVDRPSGVFDLLQEHVVRARQDDSRWTGLSQARIQAEWERRRERDFASEVTLAEIYEKLQAILEMSRSEADWIHDRELKIESSVCVAVPGVADWLDTCRTGAFTVAFLSDTYLPSHFVRNLLVRLGLSSEIDHVIVSSDYGYMKATGRLFSTLLERLSVNRSAVLHIGDNSHSDVEVPSRMGIRTSLRPAVQRSRYESLLMSSVAAPSAIRSLTAGTIREARRRGHRSTKHQSTIWGIGASVAGPLLTAFTIWTLRMARELELDRLYYFARDGEVLYEIARTLQCSHWKDVEVRYFYASRQALLLPALTGIDDEALEWIMAPTWRLSLRMILKRLGIDVDDVRAAKAIRGLRDMDLDKNLDAGERRKVRSLLRDEAFWRFLSPRVEAARETALEYMNQEGMCDNTTWAMVDIGWSGTLQRSVSRILDVSGAQQDVTGLYFGLKRHKKHRDGDRMMSYFSHPGSPRSVEYAGYPVPVFEAFSAARHGGVERYQRLGNGYLGPKLRAVENRRAIDWGVEVQQDAIQTYAELLSAIDEPTLSALSASTDLLEELFAEFFLRPTRAEAVAFGAFPDSEDQNESYHLPLAQPYRFRDFLAARKGSSARYHNEWVPASLKLTAGPLRRLAKQLLRAHR